MGWWGKLRDGYKDFEDFEAHDEIYGLSSRLGLGDADTTWHANPWIKGSVEPSDYSIMEFPKQYLHVRCCRTGQEWIRPLRGNSLMDLATQIRKWVKEEFGGELFLDGKIQPRLEGDYYAQLFIDGRAPDESCWESGGFWLTDESNALLRGSPWTP